MKLTHVELRGECFGTEPPFARYNQKTQFEWFPFPIKKKHWENLLSFFLVG